jgi:INO80 complex subunit C
MPLPADPASEEAHNQLLTSLSTTNSPKPFRHPSWKPQRRNKNVGQMITDSTRREASLLATQNNSGAATPQASSTGISTPRHIAANEGNRGQQNIAQAAQSLSTLVLERNLQNLQNASLPPTRGAGPVATYTNIESAPSLHPAGKRHYCDITGLPAPYTDPKTRLRYRNQEIFGVVRGLGQGVAEMYLEARGAHVVLK